MRSMSQGQGHRRGREYLVAGDALRRYAVRPPRRTMSRHDGSSRPA